MSTPEEVAQTVDRDTFRDLVVAAVRLHDSIYYLPGIEFVTGMPDAVVQAYTALQQPILRARRGDEGTRS